VSDRVTKSKSNNCCTVLNTLIGNYVLKNVQYHGTNVEKKYIYYVKGDYSLIQLFKSKKLSTRTKIRLYKTLVRPIVKYTLAEYEEHINKFECPNNFSKITQVLQKIEKINNINISIQPSQLEETLKNIQSIN